MNRSTYTRLCLVLTTLIFAAVVARSADPHPYHEGNYGTAGLPHTDLSGSRATWDYTNLNEWPELCRTGSRQSPISFTNVDPSDVVKDAPLKRLQFSSKCFFPKDETQMRVVNDGAVNMVSFERQGRLPEDLSECTVVDPLNKSRTFYFSELHFHATSEHKFRNLRPDVEMHLSFVTDEVKEKKREVLMVAVMLKASTSINSTSVRALRHILVDGSLPRRHAMTTCFLTEDMSITSLLPARESYLLYDGSETHPPCRENVRWVVMTSPVLISRVAVGKLRDAMDQLLPNDFHRFGNARPPQALNGRRIYRFDDTSVPQGGRRSDGNLDDAWTKKRPGTGAGALNETEVVVGDLFRLQEEAEPEDSAFVDLDAYGDDDKTETTTRVNAEPNSSGSNSGKAPLGTEVVVVETNATVVASSSAVGAVERRQETETSGPASSAGAASADEAGSNATHHEGLPEQHQKQRQPPYHNTNESSHDGSASAAAATASSASAHRTEAATTTTAAPVEASNEESGSNNATVADAASSAQAEPVPAANATLDTHNESGSEAVAAPLENATAATASTSTTKKPSTRKGKKAHDAPLKNISETETISNKTKNAAKSLNATATSSWTRFKNFATQATVTTKSYVERHPGRAAVIALCSVAILFLIGTCIRGWKSPVYVVGIDPSELQPLNTNPAFGQYGGTGAAAVRPANQRAD